MKPGDPELPRATDVVVIGAGMVGAACALALASAGHQVLVVDQAGPVSGTTGSGEGNILVSDKLPGPELELARRSIRLWHGLAAQAGGAFEFEPKGGLVVAHGETQLAGLTALAGAQRRCGVLAEVLGPGGLREAEPHISASLAGGVVYPQDCQVQPMLAASWMLGAARRKGARLAWGTEVTGARLDAGGRLTAVRTSSGTIAAGAAVNAAGPWGSLVAQRLGGVLPVRPRRGHMLVTEPLPPLIRHKVYDAGYVGTVTSDSDTVQVSAVVESTRSGTVLVGSSREFAGFDRQPRLAVLAAMAQRAAALFPVLSRLQVIRCYVGFRPASPDHLPIIGADPLVGSLYHACGHEGAGIGLAPATAELVRDLLAAEPPAVSAAPFAPGRFRPAVAAGETGEAR